LLGISALSTRGYADELKTIQADKNIFNLDYGDRKVLTSLDGGVKISESGVGLDNAKSNTSKIRIDPALHKIDADFNVKSSNVIGDLSSNVDAYPLASDVAGKAKGFADHHSGMVGLNFIEHTSIVTLPMISAPEHKTGIPNGIPVIKRTGFPVGDDSWACHYAHSF